MLVERILRSIARRRQILPALTDRTDRYRSAVTPMEWSMEEVTD